MLDIGVGGTELVYFATFNRRLDGGIMVTASHNPPDYNGMKMVREESRPISADTGLKDIRALAERGEFAPATRRGIGAHRRRQTGLHRASIVRTSIAPSSRRSRSS